MHPLIWIGAALGALAFWRRKHLKEDAEKVTTVAKDAGSRVSAAAQDARVAATARMAEARSGRKALVLELGEAVYAGRADSGSDMDAEVERLVGAIAEIDAAIAAEKEAAEESEEAPTE